MNEKIRVLHLEDSPLDAALIRRKLAADRLACEITHVDDEPGFASALAGGPFDLILCDYHVGSYDGLSALALARQKQPDVPVIIISGELGDEKAVECLKLGAADYVLKDRLGRLVPVVKRALAEANERRKRALAEEALQKSLAELEQRVAERTAELRESEQRFMAFMDHTPAVVAIKSAEGRHVFANRGMETLFRLKPGELIGKRDHEWLPAEVAAEVSAVDRRVMETGQPVQAVEMVPTPDGRPAYWLSSKFPLPGHNGEWLVGVVKINITDQRQAENSLRESEATLRAVIEASPDIITLIDNGGGVRAESQAVQDILGIPGKEILDRNFADLIGTLVHPEDREGVFQTFQGVLTGEREQGLVRFRIRHAAGHWVIVESRARLMRDAGDRPAAIVVVTRDVTAQAQLEEKLTQAKEEADRANRAKSEFLSRMSHELRTPLNAILGFGQLLEMDSITDEQRRAVGLILKGGRHLLDLINEVLDLARIEAGGIQLSPEPVAVCGLLGEAVALVRPLASQRGIAIDPTPLEKCADMHAQADRQRLRQVALNLLSNAVKYNRDGGHVALACEVRDGRVRVSVRDTGPGIAPEKISRLFTAFDRLGAEQSAVEGTGLGLALSRSLIEAMGGTMGATSAIGEGSTFWLELPLTESPVQRYERLDGDGGAPAVPAASAQRTVLLIEDNLSNIELLELVLKQRPNVKLLSAMQGSLGLELAHQHRPDLILLDLHLPDLHGHEVLHRLRAEAPLREVPVVVISADATPGQITRLKEAGARAYLTKPFDLKQFMRLLDEVLSA